MIFEPAEIDECSADFEGADGGVVLVLDPCFGAEALIEERPGVLRGGRHEAVNQRAGGADLVSGGKLHEVKDKWGEATVAGWVLVVSHPSDKNKGVARMGHPGSGWGGA